jgi:isocitrate/isopropylmalate dehydrogenase
MITIAWLPGDGVGREVTEGSADLIRSLEPWGGVRTTGPWPVGATGFQETGHVLPDETLAACVAADAVLLGAVGEDPGVDTDRCPRPELALIALRRELGLDVSVREVIDPHTRTSTTVVRNLLGGAYLDDSKRQEGDGTGPARDMVELYPDKIAVVADIACDHAQRMQGRRLISVDKATLYATSRLWRRVVDEVIVRRGLTFDHVYVDRAAYELASGAELPGVVVTEGLFGDILSDLIAGRAGSPALCGSASIRPRAEAGCRGLYEPAHGSAPRRAGQDQVNPAGGFLSLTMLLESFPATAELGRAVRAGLQAVLASGPYTYDLVAPGQEGIGTRAFSELVAEQVRAAITAQER